MMMEPMFDPFESLFTDDQVASIPQGLLFTNEVMLSDFNTDSTPIDSIPYTSDDAGLHVHHW